MTSTRFSLTSDQLELLLAFEENKGLLKLSEAVGRDPSVISRGLQRIAEDFPVLIKVKGRWELTALGRQINEQTKQFTSQLQHLLPAKVKKSDEISFSSKSVLIIINAQVGLMDSTQEGRNNSDAERNIIKIMNHWRKTKRPVIHVKHISENPNSIFFRNAPGSQILSSMSPGHDEKVFEKTNSGAFCNTGLNDHLNQIEVENLLLVGFTANECIDATAKEASSLGYTSFVVGDATAMFDMRDQEGRLIKADRLHKLTLANINAFFAKVIQTSNVFS